MTVGHKNMKKRKDTFLIVLGVLAVAYVSSYVLLLRHAYSINQRFEAVAWSGGIRYLDVSTEEAGERNEKMLLFLHLFYSPINYVHWKVFDGPMHCPALPMYRMSR
jgi:hypothetical protein